MLKDIKSKPMQHFVSVKDIPDLNDLLQEAFEIKTYPMIQKSLGRGKSMALVFFYPNLYVRLSAMKAAKELGLDTILINLYEEVQQIETENGIILSTKNSHHLADLATFIGQHCDLIGIYTQAKLRVREEDYQEKFLNGFVKNAGVPIINLGSAIRNPLQSLADIITLEEFKKSEQPKMVLSWVPDTAALSQANINSFLEWIRWMEFDLTVTHPPNYRLSDEFMEGIKTEYNQERAFENADFIYALNWSSYRDYGKVLCKDLSWTINPGKMQLSKEAYLLHSLPLGRNIALAEELIHNPQSLIFKQSANRLIATQLILKKFLESE